MRWIDTKSAATLRLARLPDGSYNLVLIGATKTDKVWGDAVKKMGMRITISGRTLYRKGGKFTLQEVLKVFPEAVPVELPESTVYLNVVASSASPVKNGQP